MSKENKISSILFIIFWAVFFGWVLPIFFYFLINNFFVEGDLWQREALHSTIEAIGGSLAIFLVVIILLYPKKIKSSYDYIISGGVLGIAVFDLAHSTVGVGNNFVYLHSLAIFFGGIFFLLLFLSPRIANFFTIKWVLLVIFFTLFISVLSFIRPDLTPVMLIEGGSFSFITKILNYIGGIFLTLSSFRLIWIYFREKENKKYLLLAVLCLLFGFSGLLFETSVIWDLRWWYLILLRFIAYVAILIYIIIVFRNLSKSLLLNLEQLDKAQKDLKKNLKTTEKKEKELEKQNDELQKLNKLMTGRELKMIELKNRIEKFEENKK